MERGEDVLASEEGIQGGSGCREGGVREAACRDHRSGRQKKLTRKVSFPDDARLVRALDPVDPWENGKYSVHNNYVFWRYPHQGEYWNKCKLTCKMFVFKGLLPSRLAVRNVNIGLRVLYLLAAFSAI